MRNNNITGRLVLYFVFFLLLASFGFKQSKVKKITEDGIDVILNYKEPYKIKGEHSALKLVNEITIDTEAITLAEAGITEVFDFCVDSEGNIYFRNRRSGQDLIYQFDSKGKFQLSFGREGRGPGELMSPKSLVENEEGQIEISDNANRRQYFFNKKGDLIREISLPQDFMRATFLSNGNVVAIKRHFNRDGGRGERPIVLSSEDFVEIKTLHHGIGFPNLTLAKTINPLELYSDFHTFCVSNNLIYVGNYGVNEYEFLVYDFEGKLIRKIRKEYTKVKVPNQIKKDLLKNAEEINLTDVIEKVKFPEFFPPFQYFFLDEIGRLYVMTYERGKNPNSFIYDIFNPDGYFIARVELDNYGVSPYSYNELPLPLSVESKNGHIYVLRDKESGYKELVVYKMKWE